MFDLFVRCLDPEKGCLLGNFGSLERMNLKKDSRNMKTSIHSNSFGCFSNFKYFNSFMLSRCHLPPPHLLWPTPVTPQLILVHLPRMWVIDSRNHMTGNQSILFYLNFNSFHPSVTLAGGSILFVQGITNAISSLSLSYVL